MNIGKHFIKAKTFHAPIQIKLPISLQIKILVQHRPLLPPPLHTINRPKSRPVGPVTRPPASLKPHAPAAPPSIALSPPAY